MPNCPRCHQSIDTQAVTCPYCRLPLKAYGHPGIPLHRATGSTFLCESCAYEADDSCTLPQRPHARECTLYQSILESQLANQHYDTKSNLSSVVINWVKRNQTWLLLLGLLFVSFLIVLWR